MKKITVLLILALMAITMIQAQETKKEKREERQALRKLAAGPESITAKNNFNADYKGATNVKWKRDVYYDVATFTLNGKAMTAYYDFDGKCVGATYKMTFAEIPVAAQKQIKAKYKDYTIAEVVFFDDNENNETEMMLYGEQFADEDNYFVELVKAGKKEIVRVDSKGAVYAFIKL